MRWVLVMVLMGPTSAVAAKKTEFSLDDIGRLKWVDEVMVSPDGQSIAFIEINPRDPFEEDDGKALRYLRVKRTSTAPRLYAGGDATLSVSQVEWSHDSQYLYFLGKRDDDEQHGLYAIPVDGGTSEKLCELEEGQDIDAFDLHPDGKRIVLIAKPKKPKEKRKAEKKGFDAVVFEESIEPSQLAVVTPRIGQECKPEPWTRKDHIVEARFSPQGDRLLVKIAPTPHVDDVYMQTRMRLLDLKGGERGRIRSAGKLGKARWSPNGRHVAFIGTQDFNDPQPGRLKVAEAKSGKVQDLLPELLGHVMDIAWLGNDHLAAVIHFGVESEVWKVALKDGKHHVLVPQGGQVAEALAASRDGTTLALTAHRSSHPKELFRLARGKLERLTTSNPWLAERGLSRQEVITYKARDGLELQGLLVYPTGYRKGRRYPLLIFVHGGPESHRSNGWGTRYSQPLHVAAVRGYACFVPNYRGSTGRGVAFSKLGQHAYATPEFTDIVDGKDHLVKQGVVDRKKVGITGGSYGGYATAWSATALSEHYAAGVMFVGISNQLSKFGTTDIPNEMHAVHARAWPWDDWQFMLERSPIYHATKSKTPLLIMHGDADPRVHPEQSLEMYRYLKVAGSAPVRLVWYPGEGHGNRRAAARYDYSVRLMRWMDHYLKGPGGAPPTYEIDYGDRLKDDDD